MIMTEAKLEVLGVEVPRPTVRQKHLLSLHHPEKEKKLQLQQKFKKVGLC